MAALFVGDAGAGGRSPAARSLRLVAALTAALVLLGAAAIVLISAQRPLRQTLHERPLAARRADAGRSSESHPVAGVGLGAQPVASQARSKQGGSPTRFVSHTTPLTVAAELGVIGLAAYLALLGGSAAVIEQVRRTTRRSGSAWERCCSRSSCIRSPTAGSSRIP